MDPPPSGPVLCTWAGGPGTPLPRRITWERGSDLHFHPHSRPSRSGPPGWAACGAAGSQGLNPLLFPQVWDSARGRAQGQAAAQHP